MNEIERAVAEIIGTNYGENQCHRETMMLAAEALREQAERSKGCEYCNSENGQGTDIWHGNQLSVGYGVYRAIKFCPMCGKSLKEVADER